MKQIRMTLATSHIDDHGDILTLEALKSIADHANSKVIPLGVEHDPRIAPIGRLVSARLTTLEDGHYAVEADAEVFEEGDRIPLTGIGEIPLRSAVSERLHVSFDRSFQDEESQAMVKAIADLLGTSPMREEKKSIDPLGVLTIIGVFSLGGIASGFLKKTGEDAYESLKKKLKQLIDRKKKTVQEVLLVFAFCGDFNGNRIEADVILTNPSSNDIDAFLTDGLRELDSLLLGAFKENESIRKLVFSYSDQGLSIMFAVRRDGIPLLPQRAAKSSA